MKLPLRWALVLGVLGCATGAPNNEGSPPPPGGADGGALGQDPASSCPDGKKTTVRGTVYDPAGKTPLYNAIVYVPSAPPAPFPEGVSCDKCAATIKAPVTSALTDAKGQFVLEGVPPGADVPLVVQIGKWRRAVRVPQVTACETTAADPDLTRLPRNKGEGDIPRIAIATGACDPMECLFRKIGIDDAEITGPTGAGRIQLYAGQGGAVAKEGSPDVLTFWTDLDQLKKYDVVVLACECGENPANKPPEALQALHDYASAGGRVYATHYHYYWFLNGPADFKSAAGWTPSTLFGGGAGIFEVDMSFPKGKAFGEWLVNVGASIDPGKVNLSETWGDVFGHDKALSQAWIINPQQTDAIKYLSFNTPLASPERERCGRVVFSDVHLVEKTDVGTSPTFPTGCSTASLSAQQQAWEFLFYDLSSCIQADSDAPTPPR
jgi:hypothetical protein